MKKRIEVKPKGNKKVEAFNRVLDLLINDCSLSFYRDSEGELHIFLEEESGSGLLLRQNGSWTME